MEALVTTQLVEFERPENRGHEVALLAGFTQVSHELAYARADGASKQAVLDDFAASRRRR
ncbi:MAG: hypothetical protein M3417_01855 [Actinomycetota bacterium]|nr:hypothetical protein [Actinomycetota bacterium]